MRCGCSRRVIIGFWFWRNLRTWGKRNGTGWTCRGNWGIGVRMVIRPPQEAPLEVTVRFLGGRLFGLILGALFVLVLGVPFIILFVGPGWLVFFPRVLSFFCSLSSFSSSSTFSYSSFSSSSSSSSEKHHTRSTPSYQHLVLILSPVVNHSQVNIPPPQRSSIPQCPPRRHQRLRVRSRPGDNFAADRTGGPGMFR